MKRKIFQIVYVFLAVFFLARCTDPEIEPFEPVSLSAYDAAASYFDYNSLTHFVVSFKYGTTPVVLDLCSTVLSTSDEKVVQPGTYTYNATPGDGILGSFSKINGQSVTSGNVTIEKDFLTYTITATLNGTNVSYTGYIFSVVNTGISMTVTGRTLAGGAIKMTDASGDTLCIPYTNTYIKTHTLGSDSYYTAGGVKRTVQEGTIIITETDDVYYVTGNILTTDPTSINVSGKWSNVINGSVTSSKTDWWLSWWTVNITDKSGFTLKACPALTMGTLFYSETGKTLSVAANTYTENSLQPGSATGGTTITIGGTVHFITSGSLTFTSSDGETITVEGTLSDGSNSYTISGTYIKPIELKLFGISNYLSYGGSYTMKFLTDDDALTATASGYGYTYSGSGNYLSVDFKIAMAAGTYTAAESSAATASNFITGYYYAAWYSYFGTMFGTITNGTLAQEIVNAGTVTTTVSGSIYTMNMYLKTESGEEVFAYYSGNLSVSK